MENEYRLPYLDVLRDQHEKRIREGLESTIQFFTDRLASSGSPREYLKVLGCVEEFIEDLGEGGLARHYLERRGLEEKPGPGFKPLPFEYKGYSTMGEALVDFMKQNGISNREFADFAGVSFRIISRLRTGYKFDFDTMSTRALKGYTESVGRVLRVMDIRPPEKRGELMSLPPS